MKTADLKLPNELSEAEKTLINSIVHKHPATIFRTGPRFRFRPPHTVILGPFEPHYFLLLCHELGHALSGKYHYQTDIERLKIERLAWEKARELCADFQILYDEDFVEEQLDSYRDWLHAKSKCKKCGLTRYQTKNGQYHCPHCDLTI